VSTASFHFHGELAEFLARPHRGKAFRYGCARAATLKNAIEALGVPHTEVGALTVNGEPATLQRIVREGDAIEIHPYQSGSEMGTVSIFLADAHLGGLARFLRMLGYDTLHENAFSDAEIRRIASEEKRIVLTRDRELLKCGDIARGCYVHALKPEAQLREVAARYDLAASARPFTRCLTCNLPLQPVGKAEIAARLPDKVSQLHERFVRCPGCDGVFWPGSHYERMQAALRPIFA
jgi:uncharacterized protein with PIN domain/sulfur carrier protein ThiS